MFQPDNNEWEDEQYEAEKKRPRRARRRGDNIPPVSDYAHWNEDAERVWYEENKYDMEHADEIIEDDEDY